MIEEIQSKIRQAQAQLRELEVQVREKRAEIKGLNDALEIIQRSEEK
jgi:cell division protein FtsB